MAFIRRKPSPDGQRVYLYRVETYRDQQGHVRQRQTYLGREGLTKDGKPQLQPAQPRDPLVEEILPFGDLALLYDTAKSLDLANLIDRFAPREEGTPVGAALVLLAINHLTGRLPLADVKEWYERSMLRYWLGADPEYFTEKRLFGVLDAVCKQNDDILRDKTWLISQALHDKVTEAYGAVNKYVFYDRTQIVYVGEHCYYGEFGYGLDADKSRRKIGMGVVVRRGDGFPVLYRVYRGNQADVTTVESVAERLEKAGLKGLTVVIDRGMVSKRTMEALQKDGFHVLAGVRGYDKAFDQLVQGLDDDQIERSENRLRRGGRVFCVLERELPGQRGKYVVYQDPRVRGELKAGFLHALSEREESLAELQREVGMSRVAVGEVKRRVDDIVQGMGKFFAWKYERGKGLKWSVNTVAVEHYLRRLGRYAVQCTDSKVSKADVVHAYLDKDEVEKVWRLGKGGLGLTGVKHYKRDRVVAYLFVCYLAYLLWALVRQRLQHAGFGLSVEKALAALKRVEVVRLVRGEKEFLQTPRPIKVEGELCDKLDLMKWRVTGV